MSSSQRFCLRWNNHQSNLLSVFEQLLQDESFVDVTLAVEGLYLKAHKMVLSACSPYFQTLFVNNPDKHPIVFLKDVPYSDMRSLLDFMYKGEVSVDQERLTAFLKVAESLRIKGLTEVNEEKCDLPTITSSLLSSVAGSSGDEGRGHMSAHHLLGHKRQSSSPSPLHHLQQHHSSMATYPPKRKRGRPRKLSGSELEASSLVGVVVGGVPAHNNNNHHHLSDIDLPSDKRDPGGLMLQNPAEMLETRLDAHKDRNMSPHRGSPASLGSHHHDRASASKSPEDPHLAHKDALRKVKEEPEPTPGPSSSHDPSQGYSRTSNSQDSDGGGGSGGSLAGGSYSAESRALDLKMDESQSKLKQTGSSSLGGESLWDDKEKLKAMLEPGMDSSSPGSLLPPAPVSKQPVRRRARRRASSTHDPAEQLTEMSVRGLNLFRYASVSEGVYKCIECEKANMVKTFKNKYSFQRHAFLYHEGHQRKVFPCPVCGKEFSRPDKMKNHMKTVHDCFMPKDCIVPLGFFLQP